MSSTGAPAPAASAPAPLTPAAPASAPVAPAAPAPAPAALPLSSDVPTALARWQAVLLLAVVIWALITTALLWTSFEKTQSGAAHADQLTRIHEIESSLFQADAIATNAFLVGGLEPPASSAAYEEALEQVTMLIVAAAEAQPADQAVLEALNHEVLRYAEQMQQARANNRQGLPVGAQYLKEASARLRSESLPLLDNLIDFNQQRAIRSLSGHQWILLAVPGVAALVLLIWFNQQLAAVFHRRINLGLGAAALLVAALTIGSAAVIATLAGDADALRDGAFHTATSSSAARTAANDAKSNESLRLIARGSGAQFEEAWQAAEERVLDEISGDSTLQDLWADYAAAHGEIVAADEAGDWDGAVELATATGEGSAIAALMSFNDEAAAQAGTASKDVESTLGMGSLRVAIVVVVTILTAAAAMAALSWGITQRRREFT